jgi:hypothetical protein
MEKTIKTYTENPLQRVQDEVNQSNNNDDFLKSMIRVESSGTGVVTITIEEAREREELYNTSFYKTYKVL